MTPNPVHIPRPKTFQELVASRISWIDQILRPWCLQATRADLLLAEHDWINIAGRVDPNKTLWAWAWDRFEGLVHEDLGIDESREIIVRKKTGEEYRGYPDARESQHGLLAVLSSGNSTAASELKPMSIDDVASIQIVTN